MLLFYRMKKWFCSFLKPIKNKKPEYCYSGFVVPPVPILPKSLFFKTPYFFVIYLQNPTHTRLYKVI